MWKTEGVQNVRRGTSSSSWAIIGGEGIPSNRRCLMKSRGRRAGVVVDHLWLPRMHDDELTFRG
jgi:hypothetical protein